MQEGEDMIFILKVMGIIIAFLIGLMIILGLSILIIMFSKFFKQILKEK